MILRKAVGSFVAMMLVKECRPYGVYSVKLSSSTCQPKDFSAAVMYWRTKVLLSLPTNNLGIKKYEPSIKVV